MDPILGTIIIFAGTFQPKGWAFCNGQLLALTQFQALFALLGTTYGGDGRTTFGLPDLRGRAPVSAGQGPGLSNYLIGQQSGTETVALNVSQMPIHGHNVLVNAINGNQVSPAANYIAQTALTKTTSAEAYTNISPTSNAFLNQATIQSQGGSLPHSNIQPVLAINYIIALQGIFPSRD